MSCVPPACLGWGFLSYSTYPAIMRVKMHMNPRKCVVYNTLRPICMDITLVP